MRVRRVQTPLWAAAAAILAGCGTTSVGSPAPGAGSPSAGPSSSVPTSSTSTPGGSSAAASVRPVPDADSIARILLAIPAAQRPSFLDPYGDAIHGARLGLGPALRISGYRADPLFVCIQHVDMKAGRAGAWTAYAVTAQGTSSSGGSSGPCPPAPGRAAVRE